MPMYRSLETSLGSCASTSGSTVSGPVNRGEAREHLREAGFAPENAVLGDLPFENADQAAAAGAAASAFRAHRFTGQLGGAQDAGALGDAGGAAGGQNGLGAKASGDSTGGVRPTPLARRPTQAGLRSDECA